MVEIDRGTGNERGSDLCEIIVSQKESELKELWEMHKSTGKEVGMPFFINNGIVYTTTPVEGDEESIKVVNIMSNIAEIRQTIRHEAESKGVIHTHPTGENLANTLMSPGDFNDFLRFSDRINNFKSNMVLTKDAGSYALFGVVKKPGEQRIAAAQDRVSALYDRYLTEKEFGTRSKEALEQMQDVVLEVADPCSTRF
jgi:hypothetical protein